MSAICKNPNILIDSSNIYLSFIGMHKRTFQNILNKIIFGFSIVIREIFQKSSDRTLTYIFTKKFL